MRRIRFLPFLLTLGFCFSSMAQTPDAVNEGARLIKQPTGELLLRWWGRGDHTYFVQQSTDLSSWVYLPIIESGSDSLAQ